MGKLSDKLERAEGMLVGLILKEPTLMYEYNINKKLFSEMGLFYVGMADRLLSKGIEVVDEISFISEIEEMPDRIKEVFSESGGWNTIKSMKDSAVIRNADAIYDEFNKWKLIEAYSDKGILDLEVHWDKLVKMTSQNVVDYIEYQINDIDISVGTDLIVEDLNFTDKEIEDTQNGSNIGIQFNKHSPLLNNLMLGLPTSDLTMFASYSGGGKSSYIMNNVIIPIAESKTKVVIVSNEMKSITYKQLLMTYVLTEKLNYWTLTRKKFKTGVWNEEDKKMINKARKIIAEEYTPYISFVKMYDYDLNKVTKIAKRENKKGAKVLVYDTMKYSGDGDNVWMSLIEDSKILFQIVSKLDMAGVVSFQLAPVTKNKTRIVDETCLSNAKQVKEVFSEMVGWRDLWSDEFEGETYDIKPYKIIKGKDGKYTKEYQTLDSDKKYKIFFHFKTRNDEVGTAIVYEFQGYQNKWIEKYLCTVSDKNRY